MTPRIATTMGRPATAKPGILARAEAFRYGEMTIADIAAEVGCTASHVRYVFRNAAVTPPPETESAAAAAWPPALPTPSSAPNGASARGPCAGGRTGSG